MIEAFKEMGVFGKVIAVLIVASAARECAVHIAETARQRKEAGK